VFGFGKPPAKPLRLIANEADDLPPLAALVQDAALKAGDLSYVPGERHFTMRMNRFCHEVAGTTPLRAPSVLRINCVQKVQVRGIDPARRDQPLSLLSIAVEPLEAPAGVLTLHFAGGGRDVRLEVECIDVLLLDLAAPRRAKSRPNHPVE
jgi:hypothetical protein